MVYIKTDKDFISLDELAEVSEISTTQIEHCVDRGLLDSDETVNKYFPENILIVRKLKLALQLMRKNLSKEQQIKALSSADIFDEMILSEDMVNSLLAQAL